MPESVHTFTPAIPGMPKNPPQVIKVNYVHVTAYDNGFTIAGQWLIPDPNPHIDGREPEDREFEFVATSKTEVAAFMVSCYRDERPGMP